MKRWIRRRGGMALVAAVILVGGCAPQLDRIEVSVQQNRDEIAQLQAENRRMLQEVQALGQLLRMDRDAGDESSAMRLARLSQVSDQLDQLLQRLDDNTEYMRDLSSRVDLIATRQGIPTLGEYKPPTEAAATSTLPEEGRVILEAAELDRNRGNLELARAGFEEFLEKYPSAEASDRAVYFLGDLDQERGDFDGALVRYQDLLARFPGSALAPTAMYKARACLLAVGRNDDAWAMGARLLEEHPRSEEAVLLKAQTEGE